MRISINKLQLAMARACLSVNEICNLSGVSRSAFARIKSGKQNVKPVTIGLIAKSLNVDVTDILEKDEAM